MASIHRGSLLGDMACEDLRSGSIIVVISAPRWSARAPRQRASTSLPLSLFTASQGNRERAGGWPHGSMPLFGSSSNTAVCSFDAWTQEGFQFLCCPALFKCLFYLQYRQRRTKCPRRCRVFDQLFGKAATICQVYANLCEDQACKKH